MAAPNILLRFEQSSRAVSSGRGMLVCAVERRSWRVT